jgi:hypothetical protein
MMTARANRLTHRPSLDDTSFVLPHEELGFDSLITQERTDGAMPFFYVRMLSRSFYERRWRGSLRAYWFSFVYQSINPVICRSPRLIAGSGSTAHKGRTMTTSTNTPTHSPASTTKRRTSRARPLAAVPATPAIILSPDEIRLVMAYRSMDDRRRGKALAVAVIQAARHSRSKAPSLRLIAGSAA